MSTQTQTKNTQANNVYSMYKQNVQKYFENMSKITPQYFQAIIQLQEEGMKTCEKTINATVSVQQEFAKKQALQQKFQMPQELQSLIQTSKLFKQVH